MLLLASIVFVTVAESPLVMTVPVTDGNVMVPDAADEALIRIVPDVSPRMTMPVASTSMPFLIFSAITYPLRAW
jgi:hypothetical protein